MRADGCRWSAGWPGSGYDGGPAVRPGGRGFHGSWVFFLARWDWLLLVRVPGDGLDALPGGYDRICPGPGRGDFEASAATAADETGGGVQDAVAQGLRLRSCEIAVQGQQFQPGQQDAAGHGRVEPRLVDLVIMRWEMAEPGVLAGADDVLDAGVDAVGGVDVGALAAPAPGRGGQVGDPQGVAPAAGCLQQGQLGAGVGPLAAGEDPHRIRPALEL